MLLCNNVTSGNLFFLFLISGQLFVGDQIKLIIIYIL